MAIENYSHKKIKIQIVKSNNLNLIPPSQRLGFSIDGSTCWLQFGNLNSIANVKNNTKKLDYEKKDYIPVIISMAMIFQLTCLKPGHNLIIKI
jgi:hypothetical protein